MLYNAEVAEWQTRHSQKVVSQKLMGVRLPPSALMDKEKANILTGLTQGPFGADATMVAFGLGQIEEQAPSSLTQTIEHEKSILLSLWLLIKRLLGTS